MKEKTRTPREYSTLSLVQKKLIALEHLELLKKKADRASKKARESHKRYFNKKVQHRLVFRTGEWVYIDKPLNLMKGKTDEATKVPSGKSIPKKDGPFRVIQVKNYTVTVDVNEIHNVVSIDRTTLAKTAKEAVQATKVQRSDDVPWKADNTRDKYVVEHIVRHKDDGRSRRN